MRTFICIWFGLTVLTAWGQNTAEITVTSGTQVFEPAPTAPDTPVPNTPTPDTTAAESASNPTGYVIDDKHKLIAGDKVSFQVLEDRMLKGPKGEPRSDPKSLVVTDSIELDIPYIGRVSAANKTCKQLAAEVKALLEKEYYYRATVIIGLNEASKVLGKVYVFGPVRQSGAIDIPANETFTAAKAIMRAGGFGDFANKKKVKVVRKGQDTIFLNMEEIFDEGKTEKDVILQPDDFIIVPQRAVNW